MYLNSRFWGGGTDEFSLRTAQAMAARGHEVWLAGPPGRPGSQRATRLGVPFCPLPSGRLQLPLIRETARLLRARRIDVLQADHGRDYWPAILARRLSGGKPRLVLGRHLAKSPRSWFSRWFLLSQCDALIAVSDFTAAVLSRGHADPHSSNPERHFRPRMRGNLSKIHVIYSGIPTAEFQPTGLSPLRQAWGLGPEHYVFAVIGSYDLPRGKGQREFLEAAARIRTDAPHARFLLIGSGTMREILQQDISRLGLQRIAQLIPYCDNMPAALNAIDCLVHPQIGTEAMGVVVCEAHACGKPVLASDLDGIPEAFGFVGCGELLPPGSSEALAAAMKRWAFQPPLDPAGRAQAHARVAECFSTEQSASRLEALYFKLLKREPLIFRGEAAKTCSNRHRPEYAQAEQLRAAALATAGGAVPDDPGGRDDLLGS